MAITQKCVGCGKGAEMANGLCYECTVAAICSVVEDERREKAKPALTTDQGREAIARMRAARTRDFDAAEEIARAPAPLGFTANEATAFLSVGGGRPAPTSPEHGYTPCRACGAEVWGSQLHWTQTDGARCTACWLAMAGRGKPSRLARLGAGVARVRAEINRRPKLVSAICGIIVAGAAAFLSTR